MATGNLSVPHLSPLPGQDAFEGKVVYTAQWPHEGVDVTGLTVGVVGTGASGTQSVPHLATQAEHLYVFQRTAQFSVPSWNAPLSDDEQNAWKANYAENRKRQAATKAGMIYASNRVPAMSVSAEERAETFAKFWKLGGFTFMQSFSDLSTNRAANETAVEFFHDQIGAVVRDPATAEALKPRDHVLGMRRICTDNGFYDAFNRDNVTLVDVKTDPIEQVTANGIKTRAHQYDLDVLVLATGFEAMTGALFKIDIRGRDGVLLRDAWRDGPVTYLGLQVAGFPNLFTLTGPHSPSTMVSLVLGNEQHVDWVAGALTYMREHGLAEIEPEEAAQAAWVEQSQDAARGNLKYDADSSNYIYVGATGKRMFMVYLGGFDRYSAICDAIAADGYRGFALTPERVPAAAE